MNPDEHETPFDEAAFADPTQSGRDPVAARLRAERPVPRPQFRGDLRRALIAQRGPRRPRRLHALIAAYAGSGLCLLAVAAVGVAGVGPLAS
jgi:hypothetical protein